MNLVSYIKHPELLDASTLTQLCSLVRRYPCFHTARMLMLLNMYKQHHEAFGEELRKAALFVPDRKMLFSLIEGYKYVLEPVKKNTPLREKADEADGADRTQSLIDSFLSGLPEEQPKRRLRADATVDYMAYLLQSEENQPEISLDLTPEMPHQNLIDDFLTKGEKRFVLTDIQEENVVGSSLSSNEDNDENEDYFTETLARIYIKQRKYDKAIEIIRRLRLKYPKKNRYFADQIRFLEKLIKNNKYNK